MDLYEFDSFQFDSKTRILVREGRPVTLTPKAADLLLVFLKRAGQVLLKDELLAEVWPDKPVEERNLNLNVYYLRKALGEREEGQKYIENFPRRGYRFAATVRKVSPDKDLTPAPLAQTKELAEEEIQLGHSESLPSKQPRFLSRQRAGLALIGVALLLVLALAVGVLVLRLRPDPQLKVARYVQLTSDGRDKGGEALLTDGARVYFGEQGPNGPTLASVAMEGGGTALISLPLHNTRDQRISALDLSPLRSEILAVRAEADKMEGELWVIPLLGGSPRRVGDVMAEWASWSPERSRIASVLGGGLYISNGDGTERRRIAGIPEHASGLRWSPNGKTLRFTSTAYRNGEVQQSLWEIAADGTSLHPLLSGWNSPPRECCGSWTPDGKYFVFQSRRNGSDDLWVLPEHRGFLARGTHAPFRLSSGLTEFVIPTISNDGKQVFAIGIHKRGELVRYDSELQEFVPFLGGISATWVSFSKSGRWVAYIDYPDLTIWRAKSDGSEKTQITFAPLQADGFSWSSDERWLAVRARTPGNTWKIYLIRPQGGEIEPLIAGESEQGVPTWSPDGSQLSFGDVPANFGKASGTEAIHTIDLKTRKLSELPGSRGFWTSRWSPDGRYLAALTIAEQRLMLFDFRTGVWRATNAVHVNNPTWTSDGNYIYFDTEGNYRALRRVNVADGHVAQLVSLQNYPDLSL